MLDPLKLWLPGSPVQRRGPKISKFKPALGLHYLQSTVQYRQAVAFSLPLSCPGVVLHNNFSVIVHFDSLATGPA